jgi:uncharacterized membrane protein
MNDAHLHMIVNHFPIIGTIIGLGILLMGMFLKNNTIKSTSFFVFIVIAIFAFLSMYTGEGAEHMVKDMPTVGIKVIHIHEELADKLALVLYLLGIISIAGIYAQRKNFYQSKLIAFMAMTVAFVAVFLATQVGTSGGEIRHTEIRTETPTIK